MLVGKRYYFSRLKNQLDLLILNDTAKAILAILASLHCGEIAKSSSSLANSYRMVTAVIYRDNFYHFPFLGVRKGNLSFYWNDNKNSDNSYDKIMASIILFWVKLSQNYGWLTPQKRLFDFHG